MSIEVNLKVRVKNEYEKLRKVILGTAESSGGIPKNPYDPKSKEFIAKGQYPKETDLITEIEDFGQVLKKYGVEVFRPEVLTDYNQIFSRDIALSIDDFLFISNTISERSREVDAISSILSDIDKSKIIRAPEEVRFEGGDIMPHNDIIFIGYSEEEDFDNYKVSRTNSKGVEFFKEFFPNKTILAFELNKSDTVAKENALHLDCCFQPLGLGHCIIYKGGFKNEADYLKLKDLFGADNCIDITQDEMYHMGSNVFSVDNDVVISESGQTRINDKLRELGYTVEEVNYKETSKMEGLFRCSTLPLWRENNS